MVYINYPQDLEVCHQEEDSGKLDFFGRCGGHLLINGRLAIVWQDSLLSLCFDRPPTAATTIVSPDMSSLRSSDLSYVDAMYALVEGVLGGVNLSNSTPGFETMNSIIRDIEKIYTQVQIHLQQPEKCSNIQQKCEYYAFRLHTSFVMAWFSRMAFRSRPCPEHLLQVRAVLIGKGKRCLMDSLQAYLHLQPLCMLASRSWAFIHNGLSSALLLGLIGETRVNLEVRKLQGDLIDILSSGEDGSRTLDTEGNVVLSKLHGRALAALKNLYNDQSQIPPATSASQMPQQHQKSTNNQTPPNGVSHMSEPEQSVYSATFPYSMSDPIYNPQSLNMMTGMSPMEMFESIIWGKLSIGIDETKRLFCFRSELFERGISGARYAARAMDDLLRL